MYAVIKTGGKQYRVEKGESILVEKIEAKAGDKVELDSVLMVGKKDDVTIGRPTVSGAKVLAEVVKQKRGPKIIVFKKRSKKHYKRTQGHRQNYTELKITDIKIK